MTAHPLWYLPVGEPLDHRRCALLLDAFRPEIVRVGRALRAKVEAEHPGAEIWTKLLAPKDLVDRPGGDVREAGWDGIGVAYLHAKTEPYGPGLHAWVQVEWETGSVRVYRTGNIRRFGAEGDAR